MTTTNTILAYMKMAEGMAKWLSAQMGGVAVEEDLIQEAYVGLIRAARKSKWEGRRFTEYAKVKIRGAMLDYLRRQEWAPRGTVEKKQMVPLVMDPPSRSNGHGRHLVEEVERGMEWLEWVDARMAMVVREHWLNGRPLQDIARDEGVGVTANWLSQVGIMGLDMLRWYFRGRGIDGKEFARGV